MGPKFRRNANFSIQACRLLCKPDASLGQALNSAWFDMIFIQFYNNPNVCGATEGSVLNIDVWQSWAKRSVNPSVKIYVGLPAAPSAASYGYISPCRLSQIVGISKNYQNFGGIMLWDASQAWNNINSVKNYAELAKYYLNSLKINLSALFLGIFKQ